MCIVFCCLQICIVKTGRLYYAMELARPFLLDTALTLVDSSRWTSKQLAPSILLPLHSIVRTCSLYLVKSVLLDIALKFVKIYQQAAKAACACIIYPAAFAKSRSANESTPNKFYWKIAVKYIHVYIYQQAAIYICKSMEAAIKTELAASWKKAVTRKTLSSMSSPGQI